MAEAAIALVRAKSCRRCLKLKPAGTDNAMSEFPIQKKRGKVYESPWCNDCHAAYCKEWWKRKRARIKRLLSR